MSEYVVALDSSGNGTYYAVVICDVSTFKSIMSYLNRITSKYHIAEVRLLRGRLVNVVLGMVDQGLIPICMYVHLPEIKAFIKNIGPRLSKKRVERVAYKAVGKAVLAITLKYLPKGAEVRTWYADRGDAAEVLRLAGIEERLYVSKEYSLPADIIAWLNHRRVSEGKIIQIDVRHAVQMYAREIVKVQKG